MGNSASAFHYEKIAERDLPERLAEKVVFASHPRYAIEI